MMGGETFNRLKAGLLSAKSAKQAEPRVVVLRLILSIAGLFQPKLPRSVSKCVPGLYRRRFPPGMANSSEAVDFVIWITVLAGFLGHCSAWGGRGKMLKVLRALYIHSMTSKRVVIHVAVRSIFGRSVNNTFQSRKSNRISHGCALRGDEVTQAVDGFAIAGPVICKLRQLKLYNY
jgi:hypothetical protein